jgi:hypothetical protein
MNRDELLALCDLYVRRRGLGVIGLREMVMPPALEIIDSYHHAEISESEKNSLLAYVRGTEDNEDDDTEALPEFDPAGMSDFADDD